MVNDIEVVGEVCIQYGGLVGRHASNTLYHLTQFKKQMGVDGRMEDHHSPIHF